MINTQSQPGLQEAKDKLSQLAFRAIHPKYLQAGHDGLVAARVYLESGMISQELKGTDVAQALFKAGTSYKDSLEFSLKLVSSSRVNTSSSFARHILGFVVAVSTEALSSKDAVTNNKYTLKKISAGLEILKDELIDKAVNSERSTELESQEFLSCIRNINKYLKLSSSLL